LTPDSTITTPSAGPWLPRQQLTSSSRGLPVHRPPPQFCPARTPRAPCPFCLCSTRAGALHIPVQTLIRSRPPAKPDTITQTSHYDTTRNNCTTDQINNIICALLRLSFHNPAVSHSYPTVLQTVDFSHI